MIWIKLRILMKKIFFYKAYTSLRLANPLARFLILVSASLLSCYASGQTAKQLTLADQYFDAGEYVTAAGLYGQYLNPKSKKTSGFPLNAKRTGLTAKYKRETNVLLRNAKRYRQAQEIEKAKKLKKERIEKQNKKNNED